MGKSSKIKSDAPPKDVAGAATIACESAQSSPSAQKLAKRAEKAARKELRRTEKEKIIASLPEGTNFSKLQVRRMVRRVAAGLPPVPTEQEENERRAQSKRDEAEVREIMLDGEDPGTGAADGEEGNGHAAGDPTERDEKNDAAVHDDEAEDGHVEEVGETDDDDDATEEKSADDRADDRCVTASDAAVVVTPDTKKYAYALSGRPYVPSAGRRAKKPVPEGYVCFACKENPISPPHWIVDCPEHLADVLEKKQAAEVKRERERKIREAGKEEGGASVKIKKKKKNGPGGADDAKNKVFISGLPFDWSEADVVSHFASTMGEKTGGGGGAVVSFAMRTFKDSRRCSGQGVLTLATGAAAAKSIDLCDGTKIRGGAGKAGRECVLKVARVEDGKWNKRQRKVWKERDGAKHEKDGSDNKRRKQSVE